MDQINQHAVCLDKNYEKGVDKLATLVASKRVVGVGESTHGTHEFFQLKADLFCELTTKHDLSAFVLEDEADKCRLINQFIQTGEGDIDELIKPLYAVWRTREFKNFILRLRDLADSCDISFIGMDVEDSALTKKPGKPMFEERDKLMADNVVAAADRGKTFVWAHNSHISKRHLDVRNTGRNLAEYFGAEYAAIGQFFGQGTFNAKILPEGKELSSEDFKHIPLSSVEVPLPKADFLEELLSRNRCHSYFINLDSEKKIDALDIEYKCRAFGAVTKLEDIDKHPMSVDPYSYYDTLAYFHHAQHTSILKP